MAVWGPTTIAADADDIAQLGADRFTGTLFMGSEGANAWNSGFRFLNVAVPQGATINSATLTLQSRNLYGTVTNIHGTIYGDNVDDASAWAASGTLAGEVTETTASADFDPTAWVSSTDYSYTITTIVAEIVARAGWDSGHAIRFVVLNDGSTADCFLRAIDYVGDPAGSARLTIDYTEAATGQFARPSSPVAAGNWTATGAASLHAAIGEAVASDSEYARSGATPVADTMELGLSSVGTPDAGGTITVRVRGRVI